MEHPRRLVLAGRVRSTLRRCAALRRLPLAGMRRDARQDRFKRGCGCRCRRRSSCKAKEEDREPLHPGRARQGAHGRRVVHALADAAEGSPGASARAEGGGRRAFRGGGSGPHGPAGGPLLARVQKSVPGCLAAAAGAEGAAAALHAASAADPEPRDAAYQLAADAGRLLPAGLRQRLGGGERSLAEWFVGPLDQVRPRRPGDLVDLQPEVLRAALQPHQGGDFRAEKARPLPAPVGRLLGQWPAARALRGCLCEKVRARGRLLLRAGDRHVVDGDGVLLDSKAPQPLQVLAAQPFGGGRGGSARRPIRCGCVLGCSH
mmetsp:Transcript_85411/g.217711  ORF Transcript_85411/g.217711 Transcript_85411/m.217711 type:complete len:318 (+) Transcript_85411:570-1523(+)